MGDAAQDPGIAQTHQLFVASTRSPLDIPPYFDRDRSGDRHFASFDVSVPKARPLGEITWPPMGRDPDVTQHFVTTDHTTLQTEVDFLASIETALAKRPAETREVVVFVHGFNNNFPEALYRFAQMVDDFEAPGVPVLFAWASAADARGYLYDRDSALLARDDLADTLQELNQVSGGRVTLVAHSLGSLVSLEALRDLVQTGRRGIVDRLQGFVMISPDVDLALFEDQVRAIWPLPRSTIVFASPTDRALRLSARLTGQRARLGSVRTGRGLSDLGVMVLDVSRFGADADNSHMIGLTSPSLIQVLQRSERNAATVAGLLAE